MKTLLITGAGRGIGLEFVRQYGQENWSVIATARSLSAELLLLANEFPNIELHTLDVTSTESIHALKNNLSETPIDLLINNAAIFHPSSFGSICYSDFRKTFDTNGLTPLQLAETFVHNIATSEQKTIINLTGHLGSLDFVSKNPDYFPGYYSYRVSKAALNMITLLLAQDLQSRGIKVIALSPGWVETEMGGSDAPLKPSEAVSTMRAFIHDLTPEHTGRFFENGEELMW